MPEIWYRGEGAGVAPGKPGGHLHDFGDGLYLTDTEDVAWVYARRRAPGHVDYRVWVVKLDRSTLGRVLDLTIDPRWNKFITDPIVPGHSNPNLIKSRLDFLRIKHELYGQYFEEFVRANNMNIQSYDAVIGPEYNLGGTQLCILHKNRQPTTLNARIRTLFVPEPWAARLAKVGGMRSIAGAAGKTIVAAGLGVLIGYLSQKIVNEFYNKDFIRKGMEKLQPEIEKYVAARTRIILDFYLSDGQAYVTATVAVKYRQVYNPLHPHGAVDSAAFADSVLLDSLGITSKKLEGSRTRTERDILDIMTILEQSFSSEVTLPKQEVDEYRDAMQQMKWYEDTLKDPNLISTDVEQLKKDREALWDWIDRSFGRLDAFQANRALWTKDGYARITGEK